MDAYAVAVGPLTIAKGGNDDEGGMPKPDRCELLGPFGELPEALKAHLSIPSRPTRAHMNELPTTVTNGFMLYSFIRTRCAGHASAARAAMETL